MTTGKFHDSWLPFQRWMNSLYACCSFPKKIPNLITTSVQKLHEVENFSMQKSRQILDSFVWRNLWWLSWRLEVEQTLVKCFLHVIPIFKINCQVKTASALIFFSLTFFFCVFILQRFKAKDSCYVDPTTRAAWMWARGTGTWRAAKCCWQWHLFSPRKVYKVSLQSLNTTKFWFCFQTPIFMPYEFRPTCTYFNNTMLF